MFTWPFGHLDTAGLEKDVDGDHPPFGAIPIGVDLLEPPPEAWSSLGIQV